jgi:RAS guanyl-releasing protein 3
MHFDMENGLAGALREFQSALTPTSAELVDLSQVPSYDWMRHVSIRNSSFIERQASMNKQHSRKVSLVLNQLEPLQFAEHITYLEHKVIRRITVSLLADLFSVYLSLLSCLYFCSGTLCTLLCSWTFSRVQTP